MLQTPPKTLAAFEALLSALDAEIREFQSLGQLRFHADGSPQSARRLTHASILRSQLRQEVAQLMAKWQAEIPAPPPMPAPPPESARGVLHARTKSVPHAMTHNEAAKRLGVRPEKIRGWLEPLRA